MNLLFSVLLVIVSLRVEVFLIKMFGNEWLRKRLQKQLDEARGALPGPIELIIISYIFGFIWSEIRTLWKDGILEYIKDLWNLVDFINNFFYVSWIFLRYEIRCLFMVV